MLLASPLDRSRVELELLREDGPHLARRQVLLGPADQVHLVGELHLPPLGRVGEGRRRCPLVAVGGRLGHPPSAEHPLHPSHHHHLLPHDLLLTRAGL